MKYFILSLAVLALFAFGSNSASAQSLVEEDYDGDSPKIVTPWLVKYYEAARDTDMNYITGMRPHHAGALTMSDDYLASPERSSERLQALAKGIKHNQEFEILMLDTVEYHIKDIDFGTRGEGWYQVATKDIAMHRRFIRKTMPAIHPLFGSDDQVSATDVQFAKAMIVHHEGALMMAHDYLDNPNAINGYLERMNLDVLRDQKQEIALMWNIIGDYNGNHCDITITPDMIDGMDDMMGHMDFSSVNCEKKSCRKDMKCCDHMAEGKHDCSCCAKMKGHHGGGMMEQCAVDMGGGEEMSHDEHHAH